MLYRNQYRVESTRLKNRDYSSNGYYFLTICTKHRECLLGTIAEGKMHLSVIGNIVLQGWNESFVMRRELRCDTFVIMPNHIHGVVVIENPVETHGRASLPCRAPRSVSSFAAGFKSAVTKRINEYRLTPGVEVWQPRFYDHVVRSEKSLCTIRDYILNNPMNWQEDEMNPDFS
ncbi:MAG: transposase [Phycisphaerae bacterium]|jgi:REP element-mobilizing transposase RayT|nr:transposase [Phycisphaerae bacterium]